MLSRCLPAPSREIATRLRLVRVLQSLPLASELLQRVVDFAAGLDEGRFVCCLAQVRIKVANLPLKAQHQGPEQVRQFGIELLASERGDRSQRIGYAGHVPVGPRMSH